MRIVVSPHSNSGVFQVICSMQAKVYSVMKSLTVRTEVVRDRGGSKGAPGDTKHPSTLPFPKQAVGMRTCWPCWRCKAAGGFPLIPEVTMPPGTVRYSHSSDGSSAALFFPYLSAPCQKLDKTWPECVHIGKKLLLRRCCCDQLLHLLRLVTALNQLDRTVFGAFMGLGFGSAGHIAIFGSGPYSM